MAALTNVPDFTRLHAAVIGDLIADHYVYTRPGKLSREAPVLVLRHRGEDLGAGGAANVACNLWALGAETRLLGAVGTDDVGRVLLERLEKDRIDCSGVLRVEGWSTPEKTRILSAEPRRTMQQLLRIDREPERGLGQEARAALCDRVRSLAGQVEALLVSDYQYGLVDDALADAVRAVQAAGAVVVLDPRHDLDLFEGLTAMTPNLAELALATGRDETELEDPAAIRASAQEILDRDRPLWLLVTLGNRGMALFGRELPAEGLAVPPSGPDRVIDVSGAGDTAASAFTLALAAGLDGAGAMQLANAAAGVVVMEGGTAVCSSSRLRSVLARAPVPDRFDRVMGG